MSKNQKKFSRRIAEQSYKVSCDFKREFFSLHPAKVLNTAARRIPPRPSMSLKEAPRIRFKCVMVQHHPIHWTTSFGRSGSWVIPHFVRTASQGSWFKIISHLISLVHMRLHPKSSHILHDSFQTCHDITLLGHVMIRSISYMSWYESLLEQLHTPHEPFHMRFALKLSQI